MKKWAKIFFLLVIFSLLSGCVARIPRQSVAGSTVTRIRIFCEPSQDLTHRIYTDPEKIRSVLLCIRQLGPDFPAGTDVDTLPGQTLTLTLYCADGSQVRYRLRNNQYLQKNNGVWRRINGETASGFFQLLLQTEGDPAQD